MSNDNLLLARLPPGAREHLRSRMETVVLRRGQRLFESGERIAHVFFPLGGLVSLESGTADGRNVQLTTVGHEGLVGLAVVLRDEVPPYRAVVCEGAQALRIRSTVLAAELRRDGPVSAVLLSYAARVFREIAQSLVCYRTHTVLQRLCRSLLTAADHLCADAVEVSQEKLAEALGADRSAISHALVELQDADAIRARYRRIVIRKRSMLEATACECYHALLDVVTAEAGATRATQPLMPVHPSSSRS